ncbi:ATP-binding protein [Hyphococcus flavus]|uniref:histidine kinase n=1 Tax=Hyphococcus flavus TaxID=1866326 RepID=A0AAE9ZL18_9PROT|nr:ATP-binding protein [Hyphococcus flavus]WDI32595.1 ATP-binding protein [Hyphococcus flavus]
MQDDLATLIRNTAAQVRARDFIWAIGISAGVCAALIASGLADWRLALVTWLAFMAALAVRYRFSSGRVWAAPVQRIVETELNAQEAELARLRMVHGVARVLPEPLFILDADGMVEHANPAALDLVGLTEVTGRHFASVLRAPNVFEASEAVLSSHEPATVEFTTIGGVERTCRAYIAPIETGAQQDGKNRTRVLIFVRDLTTERRLEQMRADFIASASHELRTPLASVIGFIETLRGHAKDDPEAREKFLSVMQSQAERMQRLVADLMSLSRIELNEHVPPRDRVDLAELSRDVIESLAPLFEAAGAIVDFAQEDGVNTEIRADRDEVFQAIQNLIDNAVKYGGDPAMVKISVGRGAAPTPFADGPPAHRAGDSAEQVAARLGVGIDNLIYVQVRDFGPGIERADLPRLTERFYRVNVERSRKSGGTGLGLAIVKHIMNRHKGGFQIESRLAGGTVFACHFQQAP